MMATGVFMSSFKTIAFATSLMTPLMLVSAPSAHAEGLSFSFGGMAVIAPKYEGSKSYKAIGFPLAIPHSASDAETSSFGSRIRFKGIDDIRFNLLGADGFEFGPVAGYRGGRKQSDGDLLGGLGDVDGGLVLGGYGAYTTNGFTFDASYVDQLTGDDTGGQLKLGASTMIALSDAVEVKAGIGTTYSSNDYMDTFFGVSSAQSGTSTASLAPYDPSAGFKDVNFSLSTDIALAPKWTMKLGGKYSRLIGDAADSPVIETKNQFTGSIGLLYKFGN